MALIWIRHKNPTLPHPKSTPVVHNRIASILYPSRTSRTEELARLSRLLILPVSPQVESLGEIPQVSEGLVAADELDVLPGRREDRHVAGAFEVFDHALCSHAACCDGVLPARIADKGDGEVWKPARSGLSS